MDDTFIIPKLRKDISIEIYTENNEELAFLNDPLGYAPHPIALPSSFLKVLDLIDGDMNLQELLKSIKAHLKLSIEPEILVEILKELNDRCFLESPNYFFIKFQSDYYKSIPVRPPVCAGSSYPYDQTELEMKLGKILSSVKENSVEPGAKFIIAPHIDFSIGRISHEAYAAAYQSIRDSDAELFIIFGTSHHNSSDIFMLSEKDFRTPLGITKTDRDIIEDLKAAMPGQITVDESSHRYEHSIELQLVLIQYLFKDRDFKILPILTGSFHNFLLKKKQPNTNEKFFDFMTNLLKSIKERGKKTLFIASADFAHIGRKFQDNFDAEPVLSQLKLEDENLINHLISGNSESFFESIAEANDKRKICGLPPIYSLLESQRTDNGQMPFKGKLLKYNQWNEIETRSAVSFASIAFY
ncbi:AmmeMemoRadiSam system protein B [Bacteroidota bacterium]